MRLVINDTAILPVQNVWHNDIDLDLGELFKVDVCLLVLLEVVKAKFVPVDLTLDKVPLPADYALLVLLPLGQVQPLHGLGRLDVLDDPEV